MWWVAKILVQILQCARQWVFVCHIHTGLAIASLSDLPGCGLSNMVSGGGG